MADAGQHAADLSIATFTKIHDQMRAVAISLQELEARPRGLVNAAARTVAEKEPLLQAADLGFVQRTAHRELVDFLKVVARVGQTVGEVAVVGQQQQPRRVHVQPAHGKEPDARRVVHQVHGPPPPVVVGVRADDAPGLEQQHVDLADLGLDPAPLDGDAIAGGVYPGRRGRDRRAVDRDGPLGDEPLARPARGDACVGERLVKPDPTGCIAEVVVTVHRGGSYTSPAPQDSSTFARYRQQVAAPIADVGEDPWPGESERSWTGSLAS